MRHLSRRRLLSLASLSPVALVARATTAAAQDPVNPPPESCPAPRIMATAGAAAGQGLRVSLFHHEDLLFPSTPCLFKIDVLGLGGELLGFMTGWSPPAKGRSRTSTSPRASSPRSASRSTSTSPSPRATR